MTTSNMILLAALVIVALVVVSQFTKSPRQLLWKVTKAAVFGTLFVVAVNWVGQYVHFHLPFNPVTALTAGFLGIPGMLAMIALHLWVFPN